MFALKNQVVKQEEYKYTLSEILQQPEIWEKAFINYKKEKEEIEKFLSKINPDKKLRVIFTGAGTSEYVGNVIVDYLKKNTDFIFESIATTDLVSNPYLHLRKEFPTLLVSFARSGNSPESLAAVEIVNKIVEKPFHLAITCAKEGKLALGLKEKGNSYVLIMPEGSNDKGFAMTSSFTSMMLSALLVFDTFDIDKKGSLVKFIIEASKTIVAREAELTEMLDFEFDRIVYLGSGTHSKLVNECRLKILELTAGEVVTCNESSMGFRHGPKSFVNENTFIVSLVSNDEYTRQYDLDILREVSLDKIAKKVLAITPVKLEEEFETFEFLCTENIEDVYMSFPFVMVAQLISLITCNRVGNTADNPSKSGTVNRVVKGVQIHKL